MVAGAGQLGRHQQGPAVDLPLGREPDHPCDDARQSRRGDGCEAKAAGDRGEGSGRLARRVQAGRRARVPHGQPVARPHLLTSRDPGHRAGRSLRRPRGAGRRSRGDQDRRRDQRGSRPDGRGERHLPARWRHLFVCRGLRRSGSRCRDRGRHAGRLSERRRRGHGGESAQPDRAVEWRLLPRHRARDVPEAGLRPALRPVAREPVPSQQADDHSRHSAHAGRGVEHRRSGDAGGRPGRR